MYQMQQGNKNIIKGVFWPPYVRQEALDATRNLDIRHDDVMIATYPKSGTHWVQEIVSLIHVNGEIENINRDEHCCPLEFSFTLTGKPPCYNRIQTWKSPRVLITHVLEDFLPRQLKEGKGKVICVFRNPKDTVVSYWHFLKARGIPLSDWESFVVGFINGEEQYGPWCDHVKQYWQRHKESKNFLFLYYEDLKKNNRGSVVRIAHFLDRSLSQETIDKIVHHSSFQEMSRTYYKNSNFHKHTDSQESNDKTSDKKPGAIEMIRKGIIGDWKDQFTVKQNELFDSVIEQKLNGSGIKVIYE